VIVRRATQSDLSEIDSQSSSRAVFFLVLNPVALVGTAGSRAEYLGNSVKEILHWGNYK
jgi:hypothetical protein